MSGIVMIGTLSVVTNIHVEDGEEDAEVEEASYDSSATSDEDDMSWQASQGYGARSMARGRALTMAGVSSKVSARVGPDG